MTRRALDLAAAGAGLVSPNPLVGCVIVSKESEIVGEGAYVYASVTHAEVIALEQAGARAKGGTAYVSLEPHSHHGKTFPCTEALIDAGIARVVATIEDPNPLVSGQGFQALRDAGIEVLTGVLADEATKLNEKFICWHEKGRPFIHLKMATSLDGRISLGRSISTAFSSEEALRRVHEMRHEHDAILVGANTVVVDDPSLTDRSGLQRRRKLVRVILDNRLRTSADSTVVKTAGETPTIIVSNSTDREKRRELAAPGVDFVVEDSRNLHAVLSALRQRDIQSILVEGGTEVAGAFRDSDLIDKLSLMIAPRIIGGTTAPLAFGGRGASSIEEAAMLTDISVTRHGRDIEITGYPSRST
ncbi:MAG: bifunctional diaminohydroxyphosphoribosylaminopyrimidine deaminase/5-amino-6-(5-phosphoribosylamino)uracil reductase RibD [Pyrinomonadaceae bacterium]